MNILEQTVHLLDEKNKGQIFKTPVVVIRFWHENADLQRKQVPLAGNMNNFYALFVAR